MADLLTIAETAEQLRVSARTVEPSREAARLVLVEGRTTVAAAAATGVSQPSVARTVGRLRRQHQLLADAYGPPERRSPAGT